MFIDKEVNPKQLSPLNLAFIGDCIYEILVRENLVKNATDRSMTYTTKV